MLKVYVAGRYRGKTEAEVKQNIQNAERVGQELLRMGYMPLVPHLCWSFWGGIVPDQVFLDMGISLLSVCDIIVVCPGFETSAGTIKEIAHAERIGMPVFFWSSDNEKIKAYIDVLEGYIG